ncbi:MAG: serine hydrolase [Defluviitaleaceae bacterium]|nr:serine hydrolase [Defluviitaleaceae bacterium]MCL2203800.1 serine hydrolase [Defluviitaleaceae bacterium]MCL2239269.1 serine hydrolase [Defluviitaleaceae bacterium]
MKQLMKKAVAVFVAAVLAMGLAPLGARAADDEPLAATRAFAVQQAHALAEMFPFAGMTIALVDTNHDFTWFHSVGYADAPRGVPVTERTLFNVGSTAKVFTAMAAMQLVEAGELDLDEPIVTYLPGFSLRPHPLYGGNSGNITARMLLTHTSGIHEILGDTAFSPHGQDPTFMNRLMPILANLHMQNEELNRVTYNNTGWAMLGVLIASLAGYDNYFDGFVSVTRDMFDDMGMYDTDFAIHAGNRAAIALPHMDAQTPMDVFTYVSMTSAGGAVSNAVDMARLLHVLLDGGGDVLSEESLTYMTAVQDMGIVFPMDFDMALGFMHLDALGDGVTKLGHGGNLQHHTELLFDPEHGFGVFVSLNSMTGQPAVHILAHSLMRVAYQEITGAAPQPGVPAFSPPGVTDADALVGWYAGMALGGIVELVQCEEELLHFVGIPGAPLPITLTPTEDGVFDSVIGPLWFYEIEGIMLLFAGHAAFAERVEILPAAPGFAERFAGAWEVFVGPEGLQGLETTLEVDERGYAFAEVLGVRMIISSIDAYTSVSPGRMRSMGSVSEAIWDGTAYIIRESGLYLRRVPEARLPSDITAPATLRFVIGSPDFTLDGEAYALSSPPLIVSGRTLLPVADMEYIFGVTRAFIIEALAGRNLPDAPETAALLPIRYVVEALGGTLRWDRAHQAVYINL